MIDHPAGILVVFAIVAFAAAIKGGRAVWCLAFHPRWFTRWSVRGGVYTRCERCERTWKEPIL